MGKALQLTVQISVTRHLGKLNIILGTVNRTYKSTYIVIMKELVDLTTQNSEFSSKANT